MCVPYTGYNEKNVRNLTKKKNNSSQISFKKIINKLHCTVEEALWGISPSVSFFMALSHILTRGYFGNIGNNGF